MPTLEALDQTVQHQIGIQRFSNGVVRRIIAILNRADAALFAQLVEVLERAPSSATVEYLDQMLASIHALNAQAYAQVGSVAMASAADLAAVEVGWQQRLYGAILPAEVSIVGVSANQAYAAALARPFGGRLLRDAFADLGEDRRKRIRDAVREGFMQGRTSSQIVRDIRGTRSRGYADGFVEVDRRHLETVVRSALSHTAATARDLFMAENAEVIVSQLWTATLDGRTSRDCVARSGLRYTTGSRPKPIGHSIPWCTKHGCGPGKIHWGCRSTAIGLLKGQTKLFGTRSSVDYRGDRPVGAQVDANLGFGDWIKRQPPSVQDRVLGATQGKLLRDGGIEIDRFYNDKGVWYSVDELRKFDAEAFKKAGL